MADKILRAAIVGVSGAGGDIVAALALAEGIELAGVADRSAAAARRAADTAVNCRAYTDDRRMLVEVQPDLVFLAVPPETALELAQLALERRCHVWIEGPLGRNLSEAVSLCRLADRVGRKLAVGTYRRAMPGYRRAFDLLKSLGTIYLARGQCLFNWGPPLGWHGDRSAGGGSLRELGSHMLDLIVSVMGLPLEAVGVAAGGQAATDDSARPYDSDDTAISLLRYGGKVTATAVVSRCFGPLEEGLELYGQNGSIHAGPAACLFRDRGGAVIENFMDEPTFPAVLARHLSDFAAAAARPDETQWACSGWEHLLTVALVEALALSDRTGHGESPRAVLSTMAVDVAECLKHTPER